MENLPPLSLYIHIPWCEKKCPYCDFNSHAASGRIPEAEYVRALIADLGQELEFVQNRKLQTIFIGGGTPSLFSSESVARILEAVRQVLPVSDHLEVTLEANPGSSEADKFVEFQQAGVTRLSIGVQSFGDEKLATLGRVHCAEEALDAAAAASRSHANSFNLDLMYGLPGQTLAECQHDIESAIRTGPSHLSFYQLTVEPNTYFHRYPPVLPSDDESWQMQAFIVDRLQQAGYTRYEVSAYARRGSECRHNINYWQYGDYIGIGAGAHGKITTAGDEIRRYWKMRHPENYIRNSGSDDRVGGISPVPASEIPLEFMMNALRLSKGFSVSMFEHRTGLPFSTIINTVEKQVNKELLEHHDDTIRPTPLGYRFLNTLLDDYI